MDYSLFAMFLLLLFGTTTWLLLRGLINKVEKLEQVVDITYEVLVIGEPTSKEIADKVDTDRKNSQDIHEWDHS